MRMKACHCHPPQRHAHRPARFPPRCLASSSSGRTTADRDKAENRLLHCKGCSMLFLLLPSGSCQFSSSQVLNLRTMHLMKCPSVLNSGVYLAYLQIQMAGAPAGGVARARGDGRRLEHLLGTR